MSSPLEDAHRQEWAKVVATLARSYGDLDIAEDAAAEAFARAVERWPDDGVPDKPGAWLLTVARHAALDRLRRDATRADRQSEAQQRFAAASEPRPDRPEHGPLADDRLRLVFTCCHPALAPSAQVALTLRLVAGLATPEVARAFWLPDATMAQRLVRAKRKIAAAHIPYRVPGADELPERLGAVLRVIYLVFREGYAPSAGDRVVRVDLGDEAVRLARLVVELLPDEGEAVGLLGLLLLHHSRRRARTDAAGDLVLLDDQDRSAWDHDAIREGASCAAAALRRGRGTYAIQAAIAACHATAPAPDRVDWPAIAGFYAELVDLDPSPAIVLNRAVAVAEVDGPAAGLAMIDSLIATDAGRALARSNHHADAARGALLVRLDRPTEAVDAYRRALTLAPTDPERRFLARRIADLDDA